MHGRRRTHCPTTRHGAPKRWRPTCVEPVEVVDVAGEQRDLDAAARRRAGRANGASSATRPPRQRTQLGQVAPQRGDVGSPAAAAARPAPRPRRTVPSPNAGWTRLTTPATAADACSPSWPAKHTASSTVSRRGEATSTNASASERSSADHLVGPLAEPVLHAVEGLEERDGVGEHLGADHLADRPQQRLGGDVEHLHAAAASAASAAGTAGGRGSGPARRARRGSRGRCGSAACRRRRGRSARRRAARTASRPPCTPGCR